MLAWDVVTLKTNKDSLDIEEGGGLDDVRGLKDTKERGLNYRRGLEDMQEV